MPLPNPGYDFHPVCEAFPAYEPEVYRRRMADYKKHPERAGDTAVLLAVDPKDDKWKIADGRHHYLICCDLGLECEFERFTGDSDELAAKVISRNANRRHETEGQRAASVAAVMKWAKGRPKNSAHAPIKTQDDVAKEIDVSKDTLKRASKVAKDAPELLPLIRDGKLDAFTAAKLVALPKAERKKVVDADDPKAKAKEVIAKFTKEKSKPQSTPTPHREDGANLGANIGEVFPTLPLTAIPEPVKQADREPVVETEQTPTEEQTNTETDADEPTVIGDMDPVEAFIGKVNRLCVALDKIKADAAELAKDPNGQHIHGQSVISAIESARKALWQSRPTEPCNCVRDGKPANPACRACFGCGKTTPSRVLRGSK